MRSGTERAMEEEMFSNLGFAAASTEEPFGFEMRLVRADSQAPVRNRVRSVNWRCENVKWKRVKARPGEEVVMAQSWVLVEETTRATTMWLFVLPCRRTSLLIGSWAASARVRSILNCQQAATSRWQVVGLSVAQVLLCPHRPPPHCCRSRTTPRTQGDMPTPSAYG